MEIQYHRMFSRLGITHQRIFCTIRTRQIVTNTIRYLYSMFLIAILLSCSPTSAQQPAVFGVDAVLPAVQGKAIDFTWMENGKKQSFATLTKGKVVLLNIWATWCGPCKREIPDLVEVHNEYVGKGAMVFGISVDQDERKFQLVRSIVEKYTIPYINIIDNLSIMNAYGGIQSIPVTIVIDANGNVVQRLVGGMQKQQFVALIEKELQKKK
jgi:thiol-disulfide isomerase/thioredoxin